MCTYIYIYMHIVFTSWSLEGKITVSVVFWCILGLLNVVSQSCFLDCTWHNWHNLFCASRLRPAVEDPQADYTILFDRSGLQIGWRNWFHPNGKNATLNLTKSGMSFSDFPWFHWDVQVQVPTSRDWRVKNTPLTPCRCHQDILWMRWTDDFTGRPKQKGARSLQLFFCFFFVNIPCVLSWRRDGGFEVLKGVFQSSYDWVEISWPDYLSPLLPFFRRLSRLPGSETREGLLRHLWEEMPVAFITVKLPNGTLVLGLRDQWGNSTKSPKHISYGYHMDIIWISYGYHMDMIWISCGYHINIIWIMDLHVSVKMFWAWDILWVLCLVTSWGPLRCWPEDTDRGGDSWIFDSSLLRFRQESVFFFVCFFMIDQHIFFFRKVVETKHLGFRIRVHLTWCRLFRRSSDPS